MPVTYAVYSEFTSVYSMKGISQAEIESTWLPYGALRVNEQLGGYFTIPFSSNNETAKDLSIHYAKLGVLLRTRNQEDSQELKQDLMLRISDIRCGNTPMITSSGDSLFASNNSLHNVWSSTQDFKPIFDYREPEDQRVDPDYIDQLWTDDQ